MIRNLQCTIQDTDLEYADYDPHENAPICSVPLDATGNAIVDLTVSLLFGRAIRLPRHQHVTDRVGAMWIRNAIREATIITPYAGRELRRLLHECDCWTDHRVEDG